MSYRNQEIVKLRKLGVKFQTIADHFGISYQRVQQIVYSFQLGKVYTNTLPFYKEYRRHYSHSKRQMLKKRMPCKYCNNLND